MELTKAHCDAVRANTLTSGAPANALPNVEALTFGYNIYKGSPFNEHGDEGKGGELFKYDWSKVNRGTLGKVYPQEVNVRSDVRCSTDINTSVIKDAKDLQESYKGSFSAGGGGSYMGFGGSFTASNSWNEQSRKMSNGEKSKARSAATCAVENLALKLF